MPRFAVQVGAVLALLSNLFSAMGMTVQRRSHLLDAELAPDLRSPPHRRRLWVFGFTLYLLAAPLDLLSYIFAPEELCAVLAASRIPIVAPLSKFRSN